MTRQEDFRARPYPGALATMERALLRRRGTVPHLPGEFGRALQLVCGPAWPAPRALRQAGLAIAWASDRAAAAGELAYHNRHHAADAAAAMARLCAAARAMGHLTQTEAATGVVAMLGHDLGHDGGWALDGRLEARAASAVCAIAGRAGVLPAGRARIAAIIRATRPDLAPGNARRALGPCLPGRGGRGLAMLRLLANEADAFASMLPHLGQQLGAALAAERAAAGDAQAAAVASHAGRLAFLLGFRRFSPAARRLGLAAICHRQVAAYRQAARRLGAGQDAMAAAHMLDRLPQAEAEPPRQTGWIQAAGAASSEIR